VSRSLVVVPTLMRSCCPRVNATALVVLAAFLLVAAPSSAAIEDVHLVVTESVSPTTVPPGGSFTISFSAENTGDADPGGFTLTMYLGVGKWTVGNANDGCSRPNDFDIVCNLSGLAGGAKFSTSVVVTLGSDATPGAIYDSRVLASNSSTNFGPTGSDAKSITVGPAPPPPPPPPGPSTLSVALRGSGSGSVISAPAGINCGASCALQFAHGTSVTLTATPSPGSVFTGWGDACAAAAQNTQCTLTVNAATAASATFDLAPTTTSTPPPPPNPKVCVVPRVLGTTLAAAKQRLTRADCALGRVTTRIAKRAQAGRVVAQHPAAGEYLAAHGKVAVVLGRRA
jgi:Divergent InlB B-repeat domain/PASTA domain